MWECRRVMRIEVMQDGGSSILLYTPYCISQCFAKFIEKYALTGNMSMRGICPSGRRRGRSRSIIDSLQEAPGAIQGYAKVAALTRPCLSSLAKENMAALSGKAK